MPPGSSPISYTLCPAASPVAATRFMADMNLSPRTVAALREHGWDVIRVSELLPANAADVEILELARRQGRAVITHDLDFSTLLALGGHARPSLITLRLTSTDPDAVTRRLLDVLPQFDELLREGCAMTIEDATLRVRRLPIVW